MNLAIKEVAAVLDLCVSISDTHPNFQLLGYFTISTSANRYIYAFADTNSINSIVLITGNGLGILEDNEQLWQYGKMRVIDGHLYFREKERNTIPLYCFSGANSYSREYAMFDDFTVSKETVYFRLSESETIRFGNSDKTSA